MHRLLVDAATLERELPELSAAAARHLRVVRPGAGEKVELFDGAGRTRPCVWEGGRLRADGPVRTAARARLPLVLFACVTKGSRWDWTIAKATELGVARIVPVISARTIVRIAAADRADKRERWMRIAEEAARQSDAVWLPEIDEAVDFQDALGLVRETDCLVGALTEPPPPPLLEALRRIVRTPGRPLAVFVGPEGDFTPEELAALLEMATPANFGPTILRAETAALFAVGVVAAVCHRDGCCIRGE